MIYEMSIKNYELKESHLWTHRNWCNQFSKWYKKNRQVTYIAPLNHIPLLSSGPGGVLQELAV